MIEILVVIAIVGILVAITLPAVQHVRESSRRLGCSNNLRQLGIAINAYHELVGCYPPGRTLSYDPRFSGSHPPCTSSSVDKGIFIHVLPHLEHNTLYNAVNNELSILGPENTTIHAIGISVFACPSDTGSGSPRDLMFDALKRFGVNGQTQMVFTSYSGNYGSLHVNAIPRPSNRCRVSPTLYAQANGIFNDVSPVRLAQVTDGLSSTLFVTEKSTRKFDDIDITNSHIYLRRGWWVTGNWGDTLLTTFYPPDAAAKIAVGAEAAQTFSAASEHAGGFNALMGDGSVHLVKYSIQSWVFDATTGYPLEALQSSEGYWSKLPPNGVWQSLGTRSGGELVHSDY